MAERRPALLQANNRAEEEDLANAFGTRNGESARKCYFRMTRPVFHVRRDSHGSITVGVSRISTRYIHHLTAEMRRGTQDTPGEKEICPEQSEYKSNHDYSQEDLYKCISSWDLARCQTRKSRYTASPLKSAQHG